MAQDSVTIKLTIIEARNLTNMDTPLIGKNDAYAYIKVGSTKNKTKVMKNCGSSATWNETFTYTLTQKDDIEISVYDWDMVKDDIIGTAKIPGATIFRDGSIENWYSLGRGAKNGGEIRIRIEYIPYSNTAY